MNILIAVNEKYIEPAKTMLYSLACHHEEYLDVFLLQSSISLKKLTEFSEFVEKKCHGKLTIVQIDKELFSNVPKLKWWSEETYYRLLAFDILPHSIDRILWLDADIIIKDNISELYNINFDKKLIVACAEDTKKNHQRLGLCDEHRYFNAGVILFDLNSIRRQYNVKDIFECIEVHREHLDALDQDVLNVLFQNKVKYVEMAVYNNETMGFNVLNKNKMEELENVAKIIHYIGSMKPWNPKGANWADKYWWKYELLRERRKREFIYYTLRHLPVKFRHYARDIFYLVKGQVLKIVK